MHGMAEKIKILESMKTKKLNSRAHKNLEKKLLKIMKNEYNINI